MSSGRGVLRAGYRGSCLMDLYHHLGLLHIVSLSSLHIVVMYTSICIVYIPFVYSGWSRTNHSAL